jgi:hypothetical protein
MAFEYTDSEGRSITRDEWLSLIEERKNPFYEYPADLNHPIWRYMDLPKFVSLLENSSLFFPRADKLGDHFEGSFSDLNQGDIERQRLHYISHLKGLPSGVTESELNAFETQLMGQYESIATLRKWERKWTYISCWHANRHESAAMWRLYSKSDDVIAVQSTFQRLLDCLRPHRKPPHGEPKLGMAHYFDPETERVRTNVHLSHFFHKFKSFEHEKELRAVMQDLPTKPIEAGKRASLGIVTASPGQPSFQYDFDKEPLEGVSLRIDLPLLIERIYVSPYAARWFADLVGNIVRRYSLLCSVEPSLLSRDPVFRAAF